MTVHQLADHLKQHWPTLRERLLADAYHPSPVRAATIPKPKGGVRQLGIPTVTDRLIQQALSQVLMPVFDPGSPRRVTVTAPNTAPSRPYRP